MSKYGEFPVVSTVKRKSKRPNDANADGDGMREYSFLKCPHCHAEDLEILTDNLYKQKSSVIRDHMVVCPVFHGERPSKRGVKVSSAGTSTGPSTGPSTPVTQSQEITELKRRMAEWEVKHETKMAEWELKHETKMAEWELKHETVTNVVAQHQVHWGDLARLMGYEPPKDPPFLLDKCRELRQLQLTNPEGALIEYKKNATLLLEQKEAVIVQQGMLLEQKDTTLEQERRLLDDYKSQLASKDSELSKAIEEKGEAQKRMDEVSKAVTTLSTRADRLQKERDALMAKYKAVLQGHEQSVRNYGKRGASLLGSSPDAMMINSLEQAQRELSPMSTKRHRA